ncbi:MAG: DUF4215 domain-containing protein [Myxococcota bacterium]
MPRRETLLARAALYIASVSFAVAAGCAEVSPEELIDPSSEAPATGAPTDVAITEKAGLDNPPVPVGQFFDGAFPSRTPNAPGSSTWDVVPAFPVDLGDTLVISPNPANDRIYVATRDGLIRSFENQPDVSTTETFLDLRDRTAVVWDGGYLGLIFHPEFGVPGSPFRNYVYTFYTTHCPLDASRDQADLGNCFDAYPRSSTGGFFNTYIRISRFEVPDGSSVADPNSEQVMLNIRLYNGSHRGGGMVFRNDGYLHVTIGDQFRYETAQDIVDTLEGGSIRISVDVTDNGDGTWSCPPGTHAPIRIFDTADEISGQWYCIPDDNPWTDPTGSQFEEYCSVGHRNPHRLAWDAVTDFMWSGEIGQSAREEINVIFCGNNYGWPFREGLTSGVRSEPASFLGVLTDPVIDFVRSEARAIIGGYVYRGDRYPELYGRYLTGDYVTGNIWAVTLDEGSMTATKDFLTVFDPGGLGTWGQDKDGEIYLGDVINGGPLYTLDRIGQPPPDAPALLSDIGAFSDLPSLVPDPAWVPYGLNQPFWSDGAAKLRWVAVPNDGLRDTIGEQVSFTETGDWSFPIGTVLMKHFELPLDEDDPSITDRLETRFFVHGDDGAWYGLTYRWRPDLSDADLLVEQETSQHVISLSSGGTRLQTWNYPSRLQCNSCHRSSGVLGPRTHQLNGDLLYPSTGRTDNQLVTWNHLGMFSPAIVEADIPSFIRSKALGDVTASLEDRARSWLASNCAGCHRPGEVQAGFDLRYETPLASQGVLWTAVRDDLGTPGTVVVSPGNPELSSLFKRIEAVGPIAMPPLAKELAEDSAVNLMREWILRIDPSFPQVGVLFEYWETGQLSALPDFDSLGPADSSGIVDTVDISVRQRDNDFAFRFRGFLEIVQAGNYTFYTNSDDGSKLFLDDVEVVDNDGLHGPTEVASAPIALTPGFYPIEVTMFERGGGQVLDATFSGPDTGGAQVPLSQIFVQIPNPDPNDPPTLDTPTDQLTRAGEFVSLDLSGIDPDGDSLYYDASDLPEGLSINNQTGQISGTIDPDAPDSSVTVTASASDGPEVAVTTFAWTVASAVCGDGIQDPSEQCDDGNTADGDGCSSLCTIEVAAVCGDGTVTPPEQCEPPDTDVCTATCTNRDPLCGDGFVTSPEACEPPDTNVCTATCTVREPACGDGFLTPPEACEPPNTDLCDAACDVRVAVCGDGFLTPPEACEDGNVIGGDGCSALCQVETLPGGADLTDDGSIIASVLKWMVVIRDDDFAPVGSTDSSRQYDSWTGVSSTEAWVGYAYSVDQNFGRVVFQEGRHFGDGGWFETLTVQVRQGGVWTEVSGLTIDPPYPGNNGITFETFDMTFAPVVGDAIRIYGVPGGSADFISVGELEVYEPGVSTGTCGDGVLDSGETCDDGNTTDGDGCTATCQAEFCGDGVINNVTETCEPAGTASCDDNCMLRDSVCGDGFITPPETCEPAGTTSCDDNCMLREAVCGDGFLTPPEACEPAGTATCDDDCTFREAACGDGFLTPPEDCEPAGTATCDDDCTLRAAVCGDGFLTPPEDCEPGGTATCDDDCTFREAVCGDGFLTPPETCEDGNVVGGDGCSATCQVEGLPSGADLTDDGSIIASVLKWMVVIRDDDFAPVGSIDSSRQYDSWTGTGAMEAWVGYEYSIDQIFGRVVFQEGRHFGDGGWFETLTVEVRQGGVWTEVSGLTVDPLYPGNNGVTFETFDLTFAPVVGDAIRIYGVPGGSSEFISVGELEVYEPGVDLCGNGLVDGNEQCDDGGTVDGDGCNATCQLEICGDGVVNNDGAEECEPAGTATCDDDCTVRDPVCGDGFLTPPEACEPAGTATCDVDCTFRVAVCGDGFLTPPEQCEPAGTATCDDDCTFRVAVCGDGLLTPPETCEDGNVVGGDGCSAVCQVEDLPSGADLTDDGSIIASVLEWMVVIRDDDFAPVGSTDSSRQYDSWSGTSATEAWVGYAYSADQIFGQVVFQEGRHFGDGGWFETLTVQVRQGGVWTEVSGLAIDPPYPGNNGVTFETFDLTFAPIVGDAIRIYGAPGGSADFISVGELEVYEPGVVN